LFTRISTALASRRIRVECRFHLGVDAMVAADARDPLIDTLVIRC
jgi:hypothetical protein